MRRGCKAPVVAPHLHRASFRMHAAMRATLPASADHRDSGLVARVKDQGFSEGCEGHAYSGGLETAFALLGDPLGFIPSESALYAGGRAMGRARETPVNVPLPALVDDGAMSEDVQAFFETFGVRGRRVPMASDGRNSDVEPDTVNDEVKLDEIEESALRIVVGPYAIDPQAADAEHQVQAAIAAKIPVRVDAFVDTPFEDWSAGDAPVAAPNMRDKNGGGHAIYLVGYAPGFYVVRNSWGEGWGEGGDIRVSPAWLRSAWSLFPLTVRRAS